MAYVFALSDCVTYEDGQRIALAKDQVWNADDPLVKKRPELFGPDPGHAHNTIGTVEQTTAAPGEKRATRRTRK